MTQPDDEQKGIVNWQDRIEAKLTPDVLDRVRQMLEQAMPQIGSFFTTAMQRGARFEPEWTLTRTPMRPAPVQKVMDKYQTLHAHFMRGLIASDDIGDLLDTCSQELIEVIEQHKDEYKNYRDPFDEDIVWGHRLRYDFNYKGSHWISPIV